MPAFDGLDFGTAKALVVEQFERSYLYRLMDSADGNVSLAARLAGKERRALGKLLKKHSIGGHRASSPAAFPFKSRRSALRSSRPQARGGVPLRFRAVGRVASQPAPCRPASCPSRAVR